MLGIKLLLTDGQLCTCLGSQTFSNPPLFSLSQSHVFSASAAGGPQGQGQWDGAPHPQLPATEDSFSPICGAGGRH